MILIRIVVEEDLSEHVGQAARVVLAEGHKPTDYHGLALLGERRKPG